MAVTKKERELRRLLLEKKDTGFRDQKALIGILAAAFPRMGEPYLRCRRGSHR